MCQAYICEIVKKKQNFKIIEFKLFKHIKKEGDMMRGGSCGERCRRSQREDDEVSMTEIHWPCV